MARRERRRPYTDLAGARPNAAWVADSLTMPAKRRAIAGIGRRRALTRAGLRRLGWRVPNITFNPDIRLYPYETLTLA